MTRIGFVRRIVLDQSLRGPAGFAWAFLTITVAALVRSAIDPWVEGVPFLTFFPAVFAASVLLGWRWGVGVLVGSALTANYFFQPQFVAMALHPREVVSTIGFVLFGGLIVYAAEALRRATIESEHSARREAEMNLELRHRVHNTLSVIQGLARQTAQVNPEPNAFFEAFNGRLLALSAAHNLLTAGDLETSVMHDLAEAAVAPFRTDQNVLLSGPPCLIPAASSVPLVLALHELGTNSTKYGALSVQPGRVTLSWSVHGSTCRLLWREESGPPVKPPTRQGLGTRLLKRQAGLEAVRLEFPPSGVTCEIQIAGAKLLGGAEGVHQFHGGLTKKM